MATSDVRAPGVAPQQADDSFRESLWSATAHPGESCPPLTGSQKTDLAIVGAGYTGLAAAITAVRQGMAVTVIDSHEPGFGASGRNGGQVIPILKHGPTELVAQYGATLGKAMSDVVSASADAVFDLIQTYSIDCAPNRNGWVQAAHSPAAIPKIRHMYQQLLDHGADVEWLDKELTSKALGTRFYHSGWLHRGAGSVHPLNYARGLARAAASLGARIHGGTSATRLAKDADGWKLQTPQGELRAARVLLATNAYTADLWPGLRQSIVPLYSMQIATDPLPPELAASILPNAISVSDTRRVVRYFRKDAQGRLLIGTRGPFTARPSATHAKALVRSAREMYPMLGDLPFPYLWAGPVAVTTDSVPHLHNPAPGLWAALGYNGRGVAMATLLGQVAAAACRDREALASRYPVTGITPIPMHAFHRIGVHAVVSYYRLLDRFH
ncbi:MAG TPA: FAD-dependent oxidoreductase [Bradyrhizobium sp.]|nr:FAD-dependent oxidoreductase [Bradyrhizobium sp.]